MNELENPFKKFWVIIAFITFDGETIESEIETPYPRQEFEKAMLMVFHRELKFAQAVVMYDIGHREICRFELSKSIYSNNNAAQPRQAQRNNELSEAQKRIMIQREDAKTRIIQKAYR